MSEDQRDLTLLLNRWFRGDRTADDALWPILVDELWVIANSILRLERPNHTLKPTELVNQLYVKLEHRSGLSFPSRGHFFRLAKDAMGYFLKDYARGRDHHPEWKNRTTIDSTIPVGDPDRQFQLVEVLDLLDRLEAADPLAAASVVLRYFCGLTCEEIAEIQGRHPKAAQRDIAFGLAWMRSRVQVEASHD
ncbi:MAG: ECF-type sigma factor [Thermoanaerobaculaceae bacterium]